MVKPTQATRDLLFWKPTTPSGVRHDLAVPFGHPSRSATLIQKIRAFRFSPHKAAPTIRMVHEALHPSPLPPLRECLPTGQYITDLCASPLKSRDTLDVSMADSETRLGRGIPFERMMGLK